MHNGSKTVAGGDPFWPEIPMSEGGSAARSWSPMPLEWLISGWNGSYGSMGPVGHVRHLDLVMGTMPCAQWVRKDRWRGSFLA